VTWARQSGVQDSFDDIETGQASGESAVFHVDIDGYEGPLDLLLELAKRQKVDLHKISILALAEQYIVFIEAARSLRLELAADYLVMAAWLTYLKSRLLLPQAPREEEPDAADLAEVLALRLRRLQAIRSAATALTERPQDGRDVFPRGSAEDHVPASSPIWQASLYDLLAAYARQRQTQALSRVTLKRRTVWSLAEARDILERLIGPMADWMPLEAYLVEYLGTPDTRRTVRASTFTASLELVREGRLALQQEGAFAPLWIRGASARVAEAG
jgi:segregation and condensation protein A